MADETQDEQGAIAERPASPFVLPATPENLQRVQVRWVGLHERVRAKVQTLHSVDRSPEERLIAQAAQAGSAAKRITWLRKAADAVQGAARTIAACKRGCSHCCHIGVVISRAEATVIAKETGASLNPMAGALKLEEAASPAAIKEQTDRAFGQPCTFLKEGQCSIYDKRPLVCRLLINLDDDDLLCRLIENHAPEVPYLNTMNHQVALVAIMGKHQDYDDIRNWFPVALPVVQAD